VCHHYFENRVLGKKLSENVKFGGEYKWSEIPACKEGNGKYVVEHSASDETIKSFPVLASAYAKAATIVNITRIISALELGEYSENFSQALNKLHADRKLTDSEHQIALGECFAKVIQHRVIQHPDGAAAEVTTVRPAHVEKIAEIYNLFGEAYKGQLAHQLLWLSALFTRYSSTYGFGTEKESPNAVRKYAEALLTAACDLDSTLISEKDKVDWINRFNNKGGAFSCTAVLYDMMQETLQVVDSTMRRSLYQSTIPLMWR
jgi:hypothetical protein